MAANWKMFKTPAETKTFFENFLPLVKDASHCEIAVCAPFVDLPFAIDATAGSNVSIGGQNLYWAKEGAFTGEISGPMLKAIGCEWVIVGHSERRQYFGETNETVLRRTKAAVEAGLKVILCVGEILEDREAGRTEAVLHKQFDAGVSGLTPEEFTQIVIAYEPVWAIGTGKTATPEMAEDAHKVIRGLAAKSFGENPALDLRILYGGSVKPDNIASLMAKDQIDGALVGGASLDPASFSKIVNY